jgi:xanthine dehydrogenase YagS FAD-binding subunit
MAYEATVSTDRRRGLTVTQMLGDGSNGAADHALEPGEEIRSIELKPPLAGERGRYARAIGRAHAEWPLVEVCLRAVVSGGAFEYLAIAAGGVAPVPLRLTAVEAALQGARADAATIARASYEAIAGASPLPMTGYKLDLLIGLTQDLLEQVAA